MQRPSTMLSMNLISTQLGIEKAIQAYHEAGYDGIGLWYDQVAAYGVDRTLELLKKFPIKVTHLIYAGPFNQTSEREYRLAREDDKEKLRVAGKLKADSVLAMTGPLNGLGQAEAFRQLNRSLRDLADTAQENGVRIGLEPLNYILHQDSFIFTLKDAMDIIEDINHPALGVFLDVYHIFAEPGLLETIKRTRGWIVGCHISDFRQTNRDVHDRVLMGDGVIPVRVLLDAFREQGWDKWYDIEIFSEELWAMEPRDFLQLAKEKYNNLWV
ncbi:MAG: sugar phosphate isomerase/epimerase family protein [Saccharofermentanales bacterium]